MFAKRRFVRVGAVLLVAVAGLVPLNSTATATTGGGTDPTRDTSPTADCHPDITAFSGDYTDQTITFSTTTACSSNPNTDASWSQGVTELDWGLDVNADGQVDYVGGVVNINHYRAAVLDLSTNQITCEGVAQWDGD